MKKYLFGFSFGCIFLATVWWQWPRISHYMPLQGEYASLELFCAESELEHDLLVRNLATQTGGISFTAGGRGTPPIVDEKRLNKIVRAQKLLGSKIIVAENGNSFYVHECGAACSQQDVFDSFNKCWDKNKCWFAGVAVNHTYYPATQTIEELRYYKNSEAIPANIISHNNNICYENWN